MKTTLPLPASSTRTALSLAAAVLCLTRLAAADQIIGSGHVISETRNVSGFHGVELHGSGEVIVTQGDTEGLVIEAEDNLLPLIESTVEAGGVLRLGFKMTKGSIASKKDVIYKLSVKTLDRLAVEGSGSIHAAALSADHAHLSLPGSGDISVDQLKADAVDIGINGSGTVKLGGEAHRQTVGINGSGTCAAKGFKTDDTTVDINGSGEAEVQANGTLTVAINGSGEVTYTGKPKVTKTVHGSGEVHPAGAKNDD